MRPFVLAAALATPVLAAGPNFLAPEVLKLDWNTSTPRAGDFNGDGLTDLVLLNQDRSRIEFLLQRPGGARPGDPERTSREDRWNPVLEVSRFEKKPLVVGRGTLSLAVGDWNGDKRPDIVYTTDEDKLVLRTQGAGGVWTQKKEFELDSTADDGEALVVQDINGDGKDDLALLTNTRLNLWLQKDGGWADVKSYVLGESGSGGLQAADLNNDSRVDFFYTAPDADAVLVRLQQEEGGFGEEWRLEITEGRSWARPVRMQGRTGLAWVHSSTGMVEVAGLTPAQVEAGSDRAASIRHAMPSTDSKGGASALGDLNGDKLPDIVLAEPRNARVWFFAGEADGGFHEGREFPALSGIDAMVITDVDGDAKHELVLLSTVEKSVGLARWQKDRLAYPEVIHQGTETLLAMAAGTLGATGQTTVALLVEGKGKTQVLALQWNAAEKKFTSTTQDLPGTFTKPGGLKLVDANQDGRGDLAVFSSLAPMQLLLSQTDAKTPWKRAEGLPDSFVNRIPPTSLSTGDLDGDGKDELFVAREQLARAFRVGADGRVVMVEQFNAPDATSQLASVVVTREGGKARVLVVDAARHKLHEMLADADGVFRVEHSHTLPVSGADAFSLLGQRLLMLGRSSFQLVPLAGGTLKLETLVTFDSELKDSQISDIIPAAFSGGPVDDLVLVDAAKTRVLEFFKPVPEATPPAWQSSMFFRVFETDPHFRGKSGSENEPHDYAAMDLNQDGRPDLCLLVHDRLLIYVQK